MAELIDQLKNSNLALVLSGGGARGGYQIGIWKALRELKISIEIVTGISVGALNGAFVVQDDFKEAKEMWENIQTSDVLDYQTSNDLTTLSGYAKSLSYLIYKAIKEGGISSKPMEELIDFYLADEEKFIHFETDFGVVVTNSRTFKEESYFLNNLSRNEIKNLLIASASLYPIMERTIIDEKPYADGGYRNHIPIELAREKNPDVIIATDLMPEINRTYKNEQNVIMIQPKWYLGDMMAFDAQRNRYNILMGYNDLMKVVGKYQGYLYSFSDSGDSLKQDLIDEFEKQDNFSKEMSSILKNNSHFLLKKLSNEWDNHVNKDNYHIALLEITARLFFIQPSEVQSVENFTKLLLQRLRDAYSLDKNDALNYSLPDYFMGRKEWRRFFAMKLSLFPEQERIFYFLSQFNKNKEKNSSITNKILFKIDPIPFTVALFIYSLVKKDNKLTQRT